MNERMNEGGQCTDSVLIMADFTRGSDGAETRSESLDCQSTLIDSPGH